MLINLYIKINMYIAILFLFATLIQSKISSIEVINNKTVTNLIFENVFVFNIEISNNSNLVNIDFPFLHTVYRNLLIYNNNFLQTVFTPNLYQLGVSQYSLHQTQSMLSTIYKSINLKKLTYVYGILEIETYFTEDIMSLNSLYFANGISIRDTNVHEIYFGYENSESNLNINIFELINNTKLENITYNPKHILCAVIM